MKCPLIAIAIVRELGEPLGDEADCLKEQCAWWSNNSQQCYIGVLAGELYSLAQIMEEIRDKLGDIAKVGGLKG